MKRATVVALLALAPAVSAAQTPSNQELCVMLATTVLTGEAASGAHQCLAAVLQHPHASPASPYQQSTRAHQLPMGRAELDLRLLVTAGASAPVHHGVLTDTVI